jgi:hypothetical protein
VRGTLHLGWISEAAGAGIVLPVEDHIIVMVGLGPIGTASRLS